MDTRLRTANEVMADIKRIIAQRAPDQTTTIINVDAKLVGSQTSREGLTLQWGRPLAFPDEHLFEIQVVDEQSRDEKMFLVATSYSIVGDPSDKQGGFWGYAVINDAPNAFAYFKTHVLPESGTTVKGNHTFDYPSGLDYVERLVKAFMSHKG